MTPVSVFRHYFCFLKFIPTLVGIGVDVKTSGTTANPAEQAYPGITPYLGDDTGKCFFVLIFEVINSPLPL